ncbi:protein of unknown function DUF218 [Methylocella silvestris BL2]|uniref:DUF218 domain-containing protein n=1 Tax=Methylocella silvestris (strain DSM 15510 / CIP 108128 / LMG 27833 / NCIMB 13906 / BL2) TaxID=395965 RepID=B8EPD8_METSB|nr:YdcF family protein [Methylocella silvestris]ACK49726.1 protein of unknown function DUF218 [Methylocella silvestris BL2]
MFFPVSKIFWLVAEPLTFLILLALIGVVLMFTRFWRAGRALAAAGAFAMALLFLTPVGVALLLPMENRFPPPPVDLPAPTGIIVLGGALNQSRSVARGQATFGGDGERLIAGIELSKRYPSARLVFTGGSGNLVEQTIVESTGVKKFWLDMGVPPDRMEFESRSRNTWENALFTRDLLRPKPGETWLLVTSAWHMPRSMGIFRRLGFDVIAYPVAYRTSGDSSDWSFLRPAFERVPLVVLAFREWIGLLAYRLTGKTDALFPAP